MSRGLFNQQNPRQFINGAHQVLAFPRTGGVDMTGATSQGQGWTKTINGFVYYYQMTDSGGTRSEQGAPTTQQSFRPNNQVTGTWEGGISASGVANGTEIRLDLTLPFHQIFSRISVSPGTNNGNPAQLLYPASLRVQGSNDGSAWVTLFDMPFSTFSQTGWSDYTYRNFDFTQVGIYRMYRCISWNTGYIGNQYNSYRHFGCVMYSTQIPASPALRIEFTGAITDTSANARTLSSSGVTVTQDFRGTASAAGQFSGSSNWLTVPAPLPSFSSAWTFCAYINWSGNAGSQGTYLMAYTDGAGNGQYHGLMIGTNWGDNRLRFISVGLASNPSYVSGYSVPANRWVHIAARYNGTNTMDFFVNGRLHSSATSVAIASNTGNNLLVIGGYNSSNFQNLFNYSGGMDSVLFYQRALTNEEIFQAYSA
jgi:hypothetical protein